MKSAVTRSIARGIHIACSVPIIGYIYSPFAEIPNYAPATRFIFVPAMLLTGLWMWKGHALQRLILERAAGRTAVSGARTGSELLVNREARL